MLTVMTLDFPCNFSIKHSKAGDCSPGLPALGIGADTTDISFNYTYSVTWEVILLIIFYKTFYTFYAMLIQIYMYSFS